MLIRQPVVLGPLVLEVWVPHLALLLSEVRQGLGTLVSVTQLELIVVSIAGAPTVGRAERVKGEF